MERDRKFTRPDLVALSRILGNLYPRIDDQQALWQRAGGDLCDFFDGAPTPAGRWLGLLNKVPELGQPSIRAILTSAVADYERNVELKVFEELLLHFEHLEADAQHRDAAEYPGVQTEPRRPAASRPGDRAGLSLVLDLKFSGAQYDDVEERRRCEDEATAFLENFVRSHPGWEAYMQIVKKGSIRVGFSLVAPPDAGESAALKVRGHLERAVRMHPWAGQRRVGLHLEVEDREELRRDLLAKRERVCAELREIEQRMATAVRSPTLYVTEAELALGRSVQALRQTRSWLDAHRADRKLRDRAFLRLKNIDEALEMLAELNKAEEERRKQHSGSPSRSKPGRAKIRTSG